MLTSMFLATKLEEHPRKIREIFLVFDRLLKLRSGEQPPYALLEPHSEVSKHSDTTTAVLCSMFLWCLRRVVGVLALDVSLSVVLSALSKLAGGHEAYRDGDAERAWFHALLRPSTQIHPAFHQYTVCTEPNASTEVALG